MKELVMVLEVWNAVAEVVVPNCRPTMEVDKLTGDLSMAANYK